jgi:hypothetical protein
MYQLFGYPGQEVTSSLSAVGRKGHLPPVQGIGQARPQELRGVFDCGRCGQ